MKKHDILMLICCLTPIVIVGILLYVFNLKSYLIFLVMLLCPILHYFLMRDMHKEHENKDGERNGKGRNKEGENKKCH